MDISLHKNARTSPQIRAEIQASDLSIVALAKKYGIHRHTVRKWKNRDDQQDKSHCPKRLNTTLSPLEEIIVIALRETLLLPLDDLLVVTRKHINAKVSRLDWDVFCAAKMSQICATFTQKKKAKSSQKKRSRIML